jgi:tRNA dimethylallyltransferase
VLELGLDPADLRQRIEQRTQQLYRDGLVGETEQLIARFGSDLPLLATIGYGEARQVLGGALTETRACAITAQRTRQFAKRQRTWFRRQHQPVWLEGSSTEERLQQALREIGHVLG